MFIKISLLFGLVVSFLVGHLRAQEKSADEAISDFLVHIDSFEEDSFTLRVHGQGNDSGPEGVVLNGSFEFEGLFANDAVSGPLFNSWTTFFDEPKRSPIDNSLSLMVPTGNAVRAVKNAKGDLLFASARFNRWDGKYWQDSGFPINRSDVKGLLAGNFGLFGLFPFMEFQLGRVDVGDFVSIFSDLQLMKEEVDRQGNVIGIWAQKENPNAIYRCLFSKAVNWLPTSIEMYMLEEKDSKTKVWESEIQWVLLGDRYLQSKSVCRDYLPNGKVCEMVSEYEWNWKPANRKEASERFVFDGFDSNTNSFDKRISWVERFRELLRKK